MRHRLVTLAAATALAIALGASPTLAGSPGSGGTPFVSGPLTHWTLDASALGSAPCGASNERVYTFTQGTLIFHYRTEAIDPGTGDFQVGHWTLTNAWATDADGTPYRVIGGETYSDLAGRLNLKIIFLSPDGGIADSASFVARAYSHGGLGFWFDFGSCAV
jgi:hypothetical protein